MIVALKISKILDKHTLVATGQGTGAFQIGDEVYVVAEAGKLDDDTIIVVPKARLEVVENAVSYVLLGSLKETVELPSQKLELLTPFGPRPVTRRTALSVMETQMSGNPATRPIEVGDSVIRKSEYRDYVDEISAASRY